MKSCAPLLPLQSHIAAENIKIFLADFQLNEGLEQKNFQKNQCEVLTESKIFLHLYPQRESSSAGRAQPCQGWGREFESRLPLKVHFLVDFFCLCMFGIFLRLGKNASIKFLEFMICPSIKTASWFLHFLLQIGLCILDIKSLFSRIY